MSRQMACFFPALLLIFLASCLEICHSAINGRPASKWPMDSALVKSEMEFMRRLFEQFNSEKEGTDRRANTAVGYTPRMEAKDCGIEGNGVQEQPIKYGLEFGLNELKPEERLVRAELHLFFPNFSRSTLAHPAHFSPSKQRKQASKMPPEQIEIAFGDCQNMQSMTLWRSRERQNAQVQMQGWARYDAILFVQNVLLGHKNEGLFVQFQRHGKQLSAAQLNRLVHLHRPFLVVYTETAEEVPKWMKPGKGRSKREVRATLTHFGNDEEVQRHMEEARKTAEYYAYGMARGNTKDGMPLRMGNSKTAKNWSKGLSMLTRRKQKTAKKKGRKTVRSYPGFDPNDPMLGFGTPNSPWERTNRHRLLQSPNTGNSINDIRALHEHGYKLEGKLLDEAERQSDDRDETKVVLMGTQEEERQQKAKNCARHNLTVDFRQLGWADRIIAPKVFEAGYCAGACEYPLDQDLHASNHAILQSLLVEQSAKAGLSEGIPPPVCCAPEKYDSLTLLYFDERDNVVLKNYPRMVVLQCGCI